MDLASHFPALDFREAGEGGWAGISPPPQGRSPAPTRVSPIPAGSQEAASLLGRPGLAGMAALCSGHLLSPARQGKEWECVPRECL